MIQLYNTLTRKKEPFLPIKSGKVSMYVCGPTVYNYIHIGNARSAIAFDTIRRYFEFRGFEVNYVSNFTDVDDKIIRTAKEQGVTPQELSEKFIEAFQEDAKALNILPATVNPKVTEHLPEIITFIQDLIEKGYAYESEGDVYFRARKFKKYGELSGKNIDDLMAGASNRTGSEQEKKEESVDFALWKKAKEGEVFWEAPFGKGRPGWHIECSVMAMKHLGETIDIHGGGQDLEFPHHENEIAQSEAHTNEIAQSEAHTGHTFANYWLHNAYVTIGEDDEKMSKSLGNFVTVHDLVKTVDPQVLRFFMATTQYRRPIRFSKENLQEAKTNLQKLKNAYDNALFRKKDAQVATLEDAEDLVVLKEFQKEFEIAMDDDFNAANGITVLYDFSKWLNQYAERKEISEVVLTEALALYTKLLSIFGVYFESEELLDDTIEALIEERNQARKEKNFARSDEIRDYLKAQGIILEDTPQGVRWKKANE